MQPVRAIDVYDSGRPEHCACTSRLSPMGMTRGLALIVCLHLHDSATSTCERQGASDKVWRDVERWPDEELTGNIALLGHALGRRDRANSPNDSVAHTLLLLLRDVREERQRKRARTGVLAHGKHSFSKAKLLAHVWLEMD